MAIMCNKCMLFAPFLSELCLDYWKTYLLIVCVSVCVCMCVRVFQKMQAN